MCKGAGCACVENGVKERCDCNKKSDIAKRAFVVIEAVDPNLTKEDFNVFSIGGFCVSVDGEDLRFDWTLPYSYVQPKEGDKLTMHCDLRDYDDESFPVHSLSKLMSADRIEEIFIEAYHWDEEKKQEGPSVLFNITHFSLQDEDGNSFEFGKELLSDLNRRQLEFNS